MQADGETRSESRRCGQGVGVSQSGWKEWTREDGERAREGRMGPWRGGAGRRERARRARGGKVYGQGARNDALAIRKKDTSSERRLRRVSEVQNGTGKCSRLGIEPMIGKKKGNRDICPYTTWVMIRTFRGAI